MFSQKMNSFRYFYQRDMKEKQVNVTTSQTSELLCGTKLWVDANGNAA